MHSFTLYSQNEQLDPLTTQVLYIRYVNGCPESKILSLKYAHLQLLLQTSQFYMRSWRKLLNVNSYYLNITLPWMKLWKWRCISRYLRNHGFLMCEKFQYLKLRYTSYSQKNVFWVFLKCLIVSDIYEHAQHLVSFYGGRMNKWNIKNIYTLIFNYQRAKKPFGCKKEDIFKNIQNPHQFLLCKSFYRNSTFAFKFGFWGGMR